MPKAKRKQLNIGITPDQYEAVRIAAEEEGQTITLYCRQAIMEKAAPEPELPDVATGLPDLADSLPAIPYQGQDTARYAN